MKSSSTIPGDNEVLISVSFKINLITVVLFCFKVNIIARLKLWAAIYDKQVYYRIITLWVLCEAMLGGVIHALKIPVSGLIVGSAAVICICLIAYYIPGKAVIIKATIIVAIFKMILSPQAPVLAYLAVFFQGGMGELLFL